MTIFCNCYHLNSLLTWTVKQEAYKLAIRIGRLAIQRPIVFFEMCIWLNRKIYFLIHTNRCRCSNNLSSRFNNWWRDFFLTIFNVFGRRLICNYITIWYRLTWIIVYFGRCIRCFVVSSSIELYDGFRLSNFVLYRRILLRNVCSLIFRNRLLHSYRHIFNVWIFIDCRI